MILNEHDPCQKVLLRFKYKPNFLEHFIFCGDDGKVWKIKFEVTILKQILI